MAEDNIMHRFIGGSKGGKAGGGSSRVAQEAPNTLQSKATLRVVEILSEGEIEGLVDGAKSIYFDDTPLQNADGSYNFSGISFVERKGTPDQAHIPGFPNVEAEVAVGTKVTTVTPIVRTVTDADTDAIMVTIRLNGLTVQNTSNGDLNGGSVSFKIEYQPNGGSYITAVDPTQGTITGKTTSTYERQYRVNLTGSAPWNIRVTRITPDNVLASVQNDIYFASYTRIIDHKLTYPDWALMGLSVDSSLFGADIPTRSYDIKGIKVKIPSNYNPLTRVYTGVWNGTFTTAWTDNPAWVLYDLITNNRYGLGDYIDAAEVDKYGLYTIAQYCDGMVSDGKGGMEPRFTFNGAIETQEDALKVLQVVASTFRGMLYWGAEGTSGVITAVQDAPTDPIKIFTPANVIDGLFTYSGTAAESQHAAAYVTWNNPDEGYKSAVEVVESPQLPSMRTYRKLPIVAYGCTSRGQANRLGKWTLDTEINEGETVVFSVGLADADTRPGQVVKIQDPAYAEVRFGGRLMGATTTALTLDAPVEFEVGQTYSIDVVLPDGTLATRACTNGTGTHTVVNLASALPQTPDALTMWAITASNLAPRLFRVLAVKEKNPAEYEITGLLHDPNKYTRVETGLNLPSLSFTKLSRDIIAPPTEITFFEYFVSSGPLLRSAVNISWKASPDSRVVRYELEVKTPGTGNNFELAKSTNGLSHVMEGTIDGTWSFRVRAFDSLGNPSLYTTLANQTLVINGQAPDDVADFQITNLTNTSVLSWAPVTSRNLSHYEIRYSSALTLANWNAAVQVIDKVSKDTTSVVVASRTGTFMIKAVTLPTELYPQGLYSADASMVSTDIDFLSTFNFVQNLVEDPTFSGTRTDVVLRGGNLELDEISAGNYKPTGTYSHSGTIDLGAVYTSRVTPNIVVAGSSSTNDVDLWADVDAILNVDGITDGQWAVEVQVSHTQDDPGASPVWSPWRPLDVGDINARAFRFQTVLWSYFSTVTPSIEELSVTIDMPDFIQSGENIASLSGATKNVLFPYTYRSARPAVVITPQGLATGDYYVVSNISAAGFDIDFYNSSGTRIIRTFDYHSKGFGILS